MSVHDFSELPELCTAAEVAAYLRWSVKTVQREMSRRRIGYVGSGKLRRIPREAVKAYLEMISCPAQTQDPDSSSGGKWVRKRSGKLSGTNKVEDVHAALALEAAQRLINH